MRFVSRSGKLAGSRAALLSLATVFALSGSTSWAQVQQAYLSATSPNVGPGAQTAHLLQPPSEPSGEWMNAHGESVVVPASYCGPGGCDPCGGCYQGGYDGCYAGGYGGMGYPDPSYDNCGMPNIGVEQCGPHYFDFSTEVVYWKKAESGDGPRTFVSEGINGPSVISTDDIDFDYEPGMRLIGRYDIGAVTFVELAYTGLMEWGGRQSVTDLNRIYFTGFSDFGQNPANGVGLGGTDPTSAASLEIRSELHNTELSVRRYWLGASPRVSGTLLYGFRYTRLTEDLLFDFPAAGPPDGASNFDSDIENDLVGAQIGADGWVTVRQGIRIGAQGKVGLANNHIVHRAFRDVANEAGPVTELAKADHLSLITEGSVSIVADIWPNMSLRAGYDVLYLNNVALAASNFDFNNAPILGDSRTARVIEEGSALYHGFNTGLEFIW